MSRLMVIGLAFGMLLFTAPASAQVSDGKCDLNDPNDPDCEKKELDCSPGFWKTHLLEGAAEEHSNLCTDLGITGTGLACPGLATACGGGGSTNCTCAELVAIMSTGGGGIIATNRHLAADCLNNFSELLDFDPNCGEDAD